MRDSAAIAGSKDEEAMSQRIQMVSKSWKRQENAPEPPERTIALLTP